MAITDHESLKYLKMMPHLSPCLARWLDLIEEFDMDIVHRPGKENVIADALSRREDLAIAALMITGNSLLEEIKRETATDPHASRIKGILEMRTIPRYMKAYTWESGLLLLDDHIYFLSAC